MGSATQDLREHLLVDVDGADGPGPSPAVKLRVQNLTRLSDTTGEMILSGVSLDVPAGVVVGVIGPSGSGKSTFLRALNRLWEPPSGTVFLDGDDICRLDVLSLRRRVGMLFQLPALFDEAAGMRCYLGLTLSSSRKINGWLQVGWSAGNRKLMDRD